MPIYTRYFDIFSPSSSGNIIFSMPSGTTFSVVTIIPVVYNSALRGSDLPIPFDNIQFAGGTAEEFVAHDPALNQTISQSVTYFGGDADNLFNIADVTLLNNANSLIGNTQNLDLTTLSGKLESIEIIDLGLGATKANTLNLSVNEVLAQGSKDLFLTDGKAQMMVNGDASDTINLKSALPNGSVPGRWSLVLSTPFTLGGQNYKVYQYSTLAAELLVQDGVVVNLI